MGEPEETHGVAVRNEHAIALTRDTLTGVFQKVCAQHGNAVALEIPPSPTRQRVQLTYAQLDALADACASLLPPRPQTDAVVALALSRTDPRLFAAMLGAMRAGYAYCAIDPAFPAGQCIEILRDCAASALVIDDARAAQLAHVGVLPRVITPQAIDDAAERPQQLDQIAPRVHCHAHDLAYVIYTSGTTGAPKGVEIEHASIANLVASDVAAFELRPSDRVVQGSSASYDSSVEELWLAWAAGATALVMDDETARLGPDLLPWLTRERATVLCPPPTLLRTLGCNDPAQELPLIRLLYVGGEALPPDLADQWSRGRRLENGYGPTECTVTCVRSTVRAGEPVTIGRAITNSHAWVIDPECPNLREITDESQGELVVGGASLARGYRGQPETTAARFIAHATLGRVYRTGDLVHRDTNGDFHYHGRIDAQVKLRGYRIELSAVEARLAAHASVREAACTVEGEGSRRRLVAHVVLHADATLDSDELRAFLRAQLPEYMVPSVVQAITALPRSVGGKLDRRQLPASLHVEDSERAFTPAATATEHALSLAFAHALGRAEAVSVTADFFDDLGLDSLTVAIAISRVRANSECACAQRATVRLAYEHRTVRLAAHALDVATTPTHSEPRAAQPLVGTSRPRLATLLQSVVLLVLLLATSQVLWIPDAGAFVGETLARGFLGTVLVAAAGFGLVALYGLIVILCGIGTKWLLIGRYTPMRARAWSMWHVRHWVTVRIVSMAPWELFELLGIAPIALRALGARIGRNVHIHRGVRLTDGGWDLITLEDFATIGQDASLRAVELEAGSLVVGPITVRRGATLETRAGMSAGAELGEGSIVRALSNLSAGVRSDHTILDGVPAIAVGSAPSPPKVDASGSAVLRMTCALALFAAIMTALLLPWGAAMQLVGITPDGIAHVLFANETSFLPTWTGIALCCAAVACAGVGTLLVQALLVRTLGAAPKTPFGLSSLTATRLAFQSALVEGAGKWLSGTMMWPMWLNLAGAKIGRGCEISTITDVIPSTIEIGAETFFADGVYLGGPRLQAGTGMATNVVLGKSCFVGNHAVIPAGTRLPRETLIGISTRGDGLRDEEGLSWFGHPAFRLPRREVVEAPRALTHEPPLIRRVNRWFWELARFVLPIGPVLATLVWFRAMEHAERTMTAWQFRLLALPLGLASVCAVLVTAVLCLKWLLIGRVKPRAHALWSCWCSRWDFLYVAWGMWAAVPLAFAEGTLLLVCYLRLMGCRIGRRALLGSGFSHVVDPDMLHFGDDVTVQALFQAHTFEDRVLKIDHVHIRDGATIGANAVMLYGADIGARTIVQPHSVVMKREVLPADAVYEGVPTRATQ